MHIEEYKLIDFGDPYLTIRLKIRPNNNYYYTYDREEETILGLKKLFNHETKLIKTTNFNNDGTSRCNNDNVVGGFKSITANSKSILYMNNDKMIFLYPGYKDNPEKRPKPRSLFILDCDDNYTYYAEESEEENRNMSIYAYDRHNDYILKKAKSGSKDEKYIRAREVEMSFIDFSELKED